MSLNTVKLYYTFLLITAMCMWEGQMIRRLPMPIIYLIVHPSFGPVSDDDLAAKTGLKITI